MTLKRWASLYIPEPERRGSRSSIIEAAVAYHASAISVEPHYVKALADLLNELYETSDLESQRKYFEILHAWPHFSSMQSEDENDAHATSKIQLTWFQKSDPENAPIVIGSVKNNIPLRRTNRGGSSGVQYLTVRHRRYYFRGDGLGNNGSAARKTLAASHFNDLLNLAIVPSSWKAIVNGEPGVLSSAALGKVRVFVPEVLPGRAVEPNLVDVIAFEFLVGNLDLHTGNFAYRGYGFLRSLLLEVFDHDHAFTIGPMAFLKDKWFGTTTLPFTYTENFINHLKRLTPEVIVLEFSPLLTPAEIDGVLFRRALILRDFELRNQPLATETSSAKAS